MPEEASKDGVKRVIILEYGNLQFWFHYMQENGVVLRLYPFLGITYSLLSGEKASLLRCGAGWVNYAIQTDEHIIPCPTMWGMKDYYLGHVNSADSLNLKKILVSEPCTECDVFGVCGGRYLYVNITKHGTKTRTVWSVTPFEISWMP